MRYPVDANGIDMAAAFGSGVAEGGVTGEQVLHVAPTDKCNTIPVKRQSFPTT